MEISIGKEIIAGGFITQLRFIHGRSLSELEQLIGYEKGRLSNGAILGRLLRLPNLDEFDLYGYSQVAAHRIDKQRAEQGTGYWKGLDKNRLKRLVLDETFALRGPGMLVKVFPATRHDSHKADEDQYPPGMGIPQWQLTKALPFLVVSIASRYPDGRLGNEL